MRALNKGKNLHGDLGWTGGNWKAFLSAWGLPQLAQYCLFLFCGWGSVETALKGKALRFNSLNDADLVIEKALSSRKLSVEW